MSDLLIQGASYVVTCDKEDNVLTNTDILIRDGVIHSIGSINVQADVLIKGEGMIVYPGLINAHHHLYQTFSRNLPYVQNMELFEWLVTLYEIWKNIDSNIVYHSSIVGLGELMKYGCTTCFDHHYIFPEKASEGVMEAQFAAAKALGIRAHFARGSMSLSKKDGGLPPDSVVQDIDRILSESRKAVETYHDPSPYSMGQVVLAPCSPFSVSADLMKQTALLARTLNVRLHTHLAETVDEENFVMEKYGMRPLAYMESLDWVGRDVWFAHGIHFNSEEILRLAQTGTGVAHCPVSNMKLSSGICRIPELLKAGVTIGLAVDGSASNDNSDLLEEIRVAYLLHRLNAGKNAPTGYEILKMATTGSAKLLGREDIGSIEAGKAGDLFMIDSRKLELIGAHLDPKSLLGTVGWKRAVDYTVINGKVVVEKGRIVTIDEEKEFYEADRLVKRYLV